MIVLIDDSGIPIVDYGGYIGKQRNPVSISQQAFVYEQEYKRTGNNRSKQLLLNCADWLVNNAVRYNNYTIWEYNFPWTYNMSPPWRSGMAQGQGVQALTKAYNLTGNEKYLKAAKTALNAFYIEVKDGGVTLKENDGWWYEEYADENGSNSRVLNGMIFALLGIHEYYEQTGDEDAKHLFNKGIIALKNHLSDYDTGSWTYYDALGNLASKKYHNIHIAQLSELYNITGDPIFKEYYDKWKSYKDQGQWYTLQCYTLKTKLAIFILNFFPLFILLEIIVFLTIKMYGRR